MNNTRPFSMRDKIGYTLGDLGNCCTEQFRAMYLTVFYTLVLKVNPVHVGILMLITKIWDAINDPIIGALVDSRENKGKGKFIPWIKMFAFPTAVLCTLGFVNVSNLDYGLRLAYMFITYVVYEIMYTCVNVPFGSLSSVMTDDVNQRTDLSRYRSLGGTIFMTVIVIAGPLILYKDNQPVAENFLIMSGVCAAIGFICLMITSAWCKERVAPAPAPKKEKLNYLEVIKEIAKNRALLGCMLSSFVGIVGAGMVNALNTYLFRDYFGNVAIMAVSGMLSVLWSVIAFVGIKFVAKKFGKKEWIMYSASFSVVVFAVLFFFPLENPMLFIIINGICYLGVCGFQVLIWALVNDAIDYQELQTGQRNEGIVYSAYTFFRKLANAVSGSMGSFALAIAGFDVNLTQQSSEFAGHLWKTYTGIYVVGYLLAVLILKFVYPLTKEKTAEMLAELAERRKGAAND
ncbi:MAG: MFS transporter [Clostridiales bacterium]|nr:MFS transporter [Roseburia sp.]MDD7636299.1 MFS transporter [Clostridiales bacterium]MDY4113330.1 MFS transporter [Roseburia sp.]